MNEKRDGRSGHPVFYRWCAWRRTFLILFLIALFNDLCRTLLSAFAAMYALLIIDLRERAVHLDCLILTLLDAETAADTAGAAGFLDSRAFVRAGAAYRVLRFVRDDLDQMLRADSHAFAAGFTFPSVDPGYTVYDVNRVERAGLYTGAEAQAAVGAALVSQSVGSSDAAVLDTDIVCFLKVASQSPAHLTKATFLSICPVSMPITLCMYTEPISPNCTR